MKYLALILIALFAWATPADAAKRCRDARGRFMTCPTPPPPPPVVVPTPVIIPAPSLPLLAPTLAGLEPIPDNFDIALAVEPAWGTGAIPPSAAPDVVGAFRFVCRAGQVAYIDPLAAPGGRSMELHQFFGNMDVKPTSNYASYRASGDSTCAQTNQGISGNRSAYWNPAMLDGKGMVVKPDYTTIYYKRRPASDPIVSDPDHPQYMGKAVDIPHGMRFIFGRNMLNPAEAPTGGFYFNCDGPTAKPGHYKTMAEAKANCPTAPNASGVRNRLGIIGSAPDCWNGKELDTADHRSHVAYSTYGDWGFPRCPSTHPFVIPQFTMRIWFTVDDNLPTWKLSTAHMAPDEDVGSMMHADFDMAWSPVMHRRFHDGCINRKLNCSGGDLGDGGMLKGATGAPLVANPRLVPVP